MLRSILRGKYTPILGNSCISTSCYTSCESKILRGDKEKLVIKVGIIYMTPKILS